MENEEQYWELISKYLSNNITLPEIEELMQWVDKDSEQADLFKELQQVWEYSQTYGQEFNPDTELAWEKVEKRLLQDTSKSLYPVKIRSTNRYWQIAAAIGLLCVMSVFFYRIIRTDTTEFATIKGEHKQLLLPDGSKIWLNEQSSLAYTADFNKGTERHVELKGEAFFEVAKNPKRPFIIKAGKTQTQVLGTSFNIKSVFEEQVTVAVFTGRVSFKSKDEPQHELILLPGDKGEYKGNGSISKSHYNNTNFMFWKSKKLEFNNVAVADVLKDIEDHYHVKFVLKDPDIASRRITSYFDGDSLDQVNTLLEDLLEVRITKANNSYIIQPNK
jgi:transmembrane sensor